MNADEGRQKMVALSPTEVDISVIVGSVESERSISACLESVFASAKASRAAVQVLVVVASPDATAAAVRANFPEATLTEMPAGTLTPRLWSEGLARSTGAAIAFTTSHCTVPVDWIAELRSALDRGAAGAGGPIILAPGSSLLDAAIYFLRYSSFMPTGHTGEYRVAEIAGDNSMYVRAALSRHERSLDDGFWEVDFHRRLAGKGEFLTMVPNASVCFGQSFSLAVISRHRFAHGIHSGRWRSTQGIASPWRIVLGSPLVPFVLLLRVFGRVRKAGGDSWLFARCSPLVLWLAGCWALGEAVGAAGVRRARRS